uniref:FAD-binding PCMH-type domain-containing protein n=1 Tax=Compsopogon caeruleus TaxID=31354 RepID=A0A7S1XA47_9RHOD
MVTLLLIFQLIRGRLETDFWDCMTQKLGPETTNAIVFLPGTAGYDARLGWCHQPDPADHPMGFVDCNLAPQIASAVMCASEAEIGICPRSGGHSFIGSSMCSGIVIDLWQMKKFSLSHGGARVTVGPGLTLGELSYNLYHQARGIFPVGHSASVGIAGFVLQGGISELASEIGLGCDNIEEVRMVQYDGKSVTANSKKNPDLFWASRGGGGGKFGIVYELTLRVHPANRYDSFVGFTALSINLSWIPNFLEWYYKWQEESQSILSRSRIRINAKKGPNDFILLGACVNCKSDAECRGRLSESGFLDFQWDNFSTTVGSTALQYLEFMADGTTANTDDYFLVRGMSHSDSHSIQGNFTYTSVGFNYSLSDAPPLSFYEDFLSHVLSICAISKNRCVVFVQNLYSGITGIDSDATAMFGLRKARQWVGFRCAGASLQVAHTLCSDLRNYLSGFITGSFLNWEDRVLPNYITAYWGDNADRLIEINRQYDPTGLFISKQPLILG